MKEDILNAVDARTPIEIALDVDTEGMTTARKLYEFLELNPSNYARWCKSNITENEFAEENADFWAFFINEEWGGQATVDYKLTAHFAKKLSVKGNSEKAEQAREYFTRVEEKVKENVIDRSQLSPQLQLMNMLVESMNKQELIQKQQAKQIAKVETTVSTLKEIFIEPIGDWKNDINSRVREISKKSGVDYQTLYSQLYGELETTAHCSLKRLQNNKKARMEKAGNTKTAIKDGTTKIAVIYDRPQLKAIFEGIVKRYAMRYCV
jgi:anti-repressor protein